MTGNEAIKHVETLRRLLNGEWVDCKEVEAALDITFAEGLKKFEFGRIAKWNQAPLNGQKIITKFRLSEKTIDQLVEFPFEPEDNSIHI